MAVLLPNTHTTHLFSTRTSTTSWPISDSNSFMESSLMSMGLSISLGIGFNLLLLVVSNKQGNQSQEGKYYLGK